MFRPHPHARSYFCALCTAHQQPLASTHARAHTELHTLQAHATQKQCARECEQTSKTAARKDPAFSAPGRPSITSSACQKITAYGKTHLSFESHMSFPRSASVAIDINATRGVDVSSIVKTWQRRRSSARYCMRQIWGRRRKRRRGRGGEGGGWEGGLELRVSTRIILCFLSLSSTVG
jgi:hypothetical protein